MNISAKGSLLLVIILIAGVFLGSFFTVSGMLPYRVMAPAVEGLANTYIKVTDPEAAELLGLTLAEREYAMTEGSGKVQEGQNFRSRYFDQEIIVPEGVFWPQEAEGEMLPIMARNPDFFKGKRVLEIGTGTGIVSLHAAKLGASKVVSTDISPEAVAAARQNATNMGFEDVMEVRLVSEDDISAYAVIRPDEQFDVIISNPPYALDLDAPVNTAVVDRGDLGFSIVRGLETYLADGGVAILFYGSSFFHEAMAKFARYEGYEVRNHSAVGLFPWEAETLYNSYLRRLLKSENLPENAFFFNYETDQALRLDFLKNTSIRGADIDIEPLLPNEEGRYWYPGMMTIMHSAS